jgi:hypothetical protein
MFAEPPYGHPAPRGLTHLLPAALPAEPDRRRECGERCLREHEVPGEIAMRAAGPSTRNPEANHRVEFMRMGVLPVVVTGATAGTC